MTPLGDNVTLYTKSSGMGTPNMMAMVQVKDPKQAAKTFSKLMPMIQTKFEEVAKGSPIPMKLGKDNDIGQRSVHYLASNSRACRLSNYIGV